MSAGSDDLLQALARATKNHPELRAAMEADPLLAAIQELLACNSSAAVTELVGRRPELLGAETDARLQQMAARARILGGADGEEIAGLIEERQATLLELWDLMAEADLSAEQVAEMIQVAQHLALGDEQALSLFDTVQELVETPDWLAARSYVEKHPELLGDKADALLSQLIALAESQHDEDTVGLLVEHRERLACARTDGLDAIGPAFSR